MKDFTAPDGTALAYHDSGGDGAPVVCLPGGPMQSSAYLGDLGGLTAHRRLIRLDPRGTGDSATPADPASYRCDRLVTDVDALRAHLGLDRLDLLAHCAGANLAVLYAARHPERVRRLALITPSVAAVGIDVTAEDRLAAARLRAAEPWFPGAYAALADLTAGRGGERGAIAPFFHGRWDDAARALDAASGEDRNAEAAAAYGAPGAYDPPATRAALARLTAPALVLAGEVDVNSPPPAMAAYAALFANARCAVQPAAGHHPWLDDPALFTAATAAFLTGSPTRAEELPA
ncbi:alpha/beta hydrolase [Streptomyces sp. CNQ-509]|uniref:alpha/beta fold hydrolase n=1 Tax=Streptomyces sp. CNQ-509 TaxID=444103 RepID=UPI00062DD2CA|nr:alpha/beta hydrolase [Streptomyces sp. CNQ-509]AKH85884.1 alpha/beta hydrolase [Streptomyces sp. CNQ-509]